MRAMGVLASLLVVSALVYAEEKKPKGMMTGVPKELLPSCSSGENPRVKVRVKQVGDNVLDLTVPDVGGYYLEFGFFTDQDGKKYGTPLMWGEGAIHEITADTEIGGYHLVPDDGKVLIFRVETKKGYVFTNGDGKITCPDKTTIQLGEKNRGLVIGHPVKEFREYKGLLIIGIGKEPEKGHK